MFITFEGPDGSGKSTIIKKIYDELVKEGYNILLTREPGGTPISEKIRDIILDNNNVNLDSRTEALLYAASRRQHLVEKIEPALKEGKIVLCDRYLDSSLAYQGGARNLGIENILNINLFATENTFPDFTIFFDVPPKIGLQRLSHDKKRIADRLDNETNNFHEKAYETFQYLCKLYSNRIIKIDATKSKETVYNEVYEIIKKLIAR